MADAQPIGLKELIAQIKAELLADHDDEQPLFVVGQVELEISFTVERNVNGGINLHVVQTGGARTSTEVQTVTVTLEPIVTPDELRENVTPVQKEAAQKKLTREY